MNASEVELGQTQHTEIDQSDEYTNTTTSKIVVGGIVTPNEIEDALAHRGSIHMLIDPLNYDIRDEASEKATWKLGIWIEEVIVGMSYPFSIIYIYMRYGVRDLQVRSFFPPDEGKGTKEVITAKDDSQKQNEHQEEDEVNHNTIFDDPEQDQVPWVFNAKTFFIGGFVINILLKSIWIGLFLGSGAVEMLYSDVDLNQSRAPLYCFGLSLLTYTFLQMTLANKRALRKNTATQRMLIHKERRLEELFNGWLPLPWRMVVFDLRRAAWKTNKGDLTKKWFVFTCCTEQQMRDALGEKILSYIERSDFRATSTNISSTNKGQIHGCQCSALALLLRLCLDKSHANPPFGKDADSMWIRKNSSQIWYMYMLLLLTLPFIVAHLIDDGKSEYSDTAIASCFFSSFFTWMTGADTTQGFTFSAILSIQRRREMMAFLNLLFVGGAEEFGRRSHEGVSTWLERGEDVAWNHDNDENDDNDENNALLKEKTKESGVADDGEWKYPMDITNPGNIELWRECRDIIGDFGSSFRKRTDANAIIMICYLLLATLIIILLSVLSPNKVLFKDYAWLVITHLAFVVPMAIFAIMLALEGDACSDEITRSSMVLANASIKMEALIHQMELSSYQLQQIQGIRFSIGQLQKSLEISTLIKPLELLGLITLDKTLVFTILFAAFTQFTLILENLAFKE